MLTTSEQILTSSLRLRTKNVHEDLDTYLTNLGLFSNVELYKNFVTLQYFIHRDANAAYNNLDLAKIIPNLQNRNRFEKVKLDILDLDMQEPTSTVSPIQFNNISEAVGFLYVIEGSKLGANYLLRQVEKIGLSDSFGARHMGADEEGRGTSWKAFQKAIDHADIHIETAVNSAENTFNRVINYARNIGKDIAA